MLPVGAEPDGGDRRRAGAVGDDAVAAIWSQLLVAGVCWYWHCRCWACSWSGAAPPPRTMQRPGTLALHRGAAAAPAPAPSLNLSVEDTCPVNANGRCCEAARQGDTERALALLAADADPLARPASDDPDQRSVLVLATLLPDTRLLRALIARGASVQGDGKGMAPLLIAVRDGRQNRSNAVMTLLANGADARVTDDECNTALHFAALGDNADIAAMLIDAGADIDAQQPRWLHSAGPGLPVRQPRHCRVSCWKAGPGRLWRAVCRR